MPNDDRALSPASPAVTVSMSRGDSLFAALRSAFPHLSSDAVQDSITDAILEWHRDHPAKAIPGHFLKVAAWRNAANAAASERARLARESAWAAAELNTSGETGVVPTTRSIAVPGIEARLRDERMRVTFRLLMLGERRTEAFAQALGLSDLPPPVRLRIVRREKDRTRRFVRRLIERDGAANGNGT